MNCVFKVDYILDYIRINFDIIYNYIESMVKIVFFWFSLYLRFNNLILISFYGMLGEMFFDELRD